MVNWPCRSRIWCLAINADISQFEEHGHRFQCKGEITFICNPIFCKVFLSSQSISIINLDDCEEQFLVENIKKDLCSSTNLRIIATPHDDFSIEALSHILKNSEMAVKTLDSVDFNRYSDFILRGPPK